MVPYGDALGPNPTAIKTDMEATAMFQFFDIRRDPLPVMDNIFAYPNTPYFKG